MNLENLVPPLELCKLIPAGEFEDSALVWVGKDDLEVFPRYEKQVIPISWTKIPAPTLQEILEKLPRTVKLDFWGDNFHVYNDVQNGHGVSDKNPATAALKLLLKWKGIEVK